MLWERLLMCVYEQCIRSIYIRHDCWNCWDLFSSTTCCYLFDSKHHVRLSGWRLTRSIRIVCMVKYNSFLSMLSVDWRSVSAAAPFPFDCGESETATWLQHSHVLLIPKPFFWLPRVTMWRLPNHLPTSQDQRAVAGLVDRLSLYYSICSQSFSGKI